MRTIAIALSAGVLVLQVAWAAILVWFVRAVNCPWSECAPRELVYFWLVPQVVLLPATALAGWSIWRQVAAARPNSKGGRS